LLEQGATTEVIPSVPGPAAPVTPGQ
jgi:hypothetical protein